MNDQNQNSSTNIDDLVKKLSGQAQMESGSPVSQPPTPQPTAPIATPNATAPVTNQSAPKPVSPSPATSQEFQASIRTMSDDMNSLKSGQKPEGKDTSRIVTPTAPIATPNATAPVTNQSAPKPVSPSPVANNSSPSISQSFDIPPVQASSGRRLTPIILYSVLGLVVLGAGLFWFMGRDSVEVVKETPSPTVTKTPDPTPVAKLADYFKEFDSVEVRITSASNDLASLQTKIKETNVPAKGFVPVALNEYDANGLISRSGVKLMGALAIRWGLVIPEQLEAILGAEHALYMYGQTESFDSKGVIQPNPQTKPSPVLVVINEIKDPLAAKNILSQNESIIISSWSKLFGITPPKTPVTFLDNIYKQSLIRYVNFKFADKSIDYSIVSAENGKSYLVITGSRESIFASIDKLKQAVK